MIAEAFASKVGLMSCTRICTSAREWVPSQCSHTVTSFKIQAKPFKTMCKALQGRFLKLSDAGDLSQIATSLTKLGAECEHKVSTSTFETADSPRFSRFSRKVFPHLTYIDSFITGST